jgi:hypothetical protein
VQDPGIHAGIAGTPPRNCYCDALRAKAPEALTARGIPEGFCGICMHCGEPGHLRHAPGAQPFTGEWCDKCFRREAYRAYVRWSLILLAIAALYAVVQVLL